MSRLSSHATLDALLQRLIAPQASTRRTAARMLRKLKIKATGPAVLSALKAELQEPRHSEAQYQMIMALGECGYGEALPFLRGMAKTGPPSLIRVGLGDAIVRLARTHDHDAGPLLEILGGPDRDLIDGAFRAMAMLRMIVPPDAMASILQFTDHLPLIDPLRVWVAAAAAGWSGSGVRGFLDRCRQSPREDVRKAAEASSAGKYLKWSPP
jgi:HEAT repeat protein